MKTFEAIIKVEADSLLEAIKRFEKIPLMSRIYIAEVKEEEEDNDR